MSSSRVLARSTSTTLRSDVCAFCHTRQLLSIERNSALRTPITATRVQTSRRGYAQKLDVKRLRVDVDKKGRLGWYKMTKDQKILLLEPSVAEAIYNDFVAHKDSKEYGKVVKQLMTKYNVTSEHISGLALMTYSIPDISDATKRAMLPSSPHKTVAGQMLQGCAEIEDPLAMKHIMTAVYLNTYTTTTPAVRDIALLFPRSEILKYRKTLATLKIAGQDDPEALTLHGLFLEAENQPTQARILYEKALQIPWVYQYSAQARHPAQLPITAPWNALGYLLKDSRDAETRDRAKWAFEQGAKKGDDPLSCFEYAAFLDRKSADWLKFTSKAAASGHREAMFQLALFYRDISGDSHVIQSSGLKQALDWLLGWRKGSAEKLAVEWFEAAGLAGHKAAILQLAEWYEGLGEKGRAREELQRIVEDSVSGREDEFAQVVHTAKGKLVGIKTA